ncbi:MAG TPA: hypothetical protein VHG92_12205 [Afifellaceae bacterium]|nr:hypothetical protein [Afifellaceae bacterium]
MPKAPDTDAAENRGRREALKTIGRFAVYVTPAMTVLVQGAEAHHRPGHCRSGPGGTQECFSPA